MCKCPGNTADAKTTCYFRVLINVTRIIVVNEVVPERLAKNKPGKQSEKKADTDGKPTAVQCCLHLQEMTNDPCLMTKE